MIPHLLPRYEKTPVGNATTAAEIYAPTMNLSLLWAGMLLNCFLTGVFTFQLVWYGSVYRNDKPWVKGVVLFVAVMALGNFIYLLYFAWWTLIADYGEYTHLLAYIFLSIFVVLDSFTAGVIQVFFTYRTWRLNNRNWYLVALLAALITMGVASGIAQAVIFISFSIQQVRSPVLARTGPVGSKLIPAIVTWNVGSMAADLVITVSILWGLWRTRTGWQHSDKVIARLARMTLEAQAPPLLLAAVFTATFIILFPRGLAAYVNNSKLNCIGLMYSLNSRQGFARQNITMENAPGGREWAIEQVKTASALPPSTSQRHTQVDTASAANPPDSESTSEASETMLPTQSVAYGLREEHMPPQGALPYSK